MAYQTRIELIINYYAACINTNKLLYFTLTKLLDFVKQKVDHANYTQ